MGRTSAGLHERDADCGIELRDRTTRRIRRKTLVHYLVSPPHCPVTGQRQAKAIHIEQPAKPPLCNRVLNPAGSGVTRWGFVRFFNEPRAAFYTEKQGKMQNKNTRLAGVVRKNFHHAFSINAGDVKKMWKCDEVLT
ncbi:TPA: hypothetical protein QIR44_001568 [Klebsiella aerogenes]|nr:hypothetical protein [Klebsiella aerogenes]HDU5190338.1 hypothetical protein [Klebsiella aerogenes]HEP0019069.1 hypothetical protein [Klebsiella aerogenes]